MDTPVVLVVDDDADVRDAARSLLEEEGYTVELAADGAEALTRLRTSPPPSLVLLDLMMPGMDGATLLHELEADAALARISIVVFTAASATLETSTLRYPVLRKPFGIDALLDVVTSYVPRLWDTDEPPTSEAVALREAPVAAMDTRRERCSVCEGRASTRCHACGESYCRPCLDAGPDGRCARCWRAQPGPR